MQSRTASYRKPEGKHDIRTEMEKTDRRVIIKKILLILLIIAAVLFLVINRESFRNRSKTHVYRVYPKETVQSIPISGTQTIRQSFISEAGGIGTVFMRFNNPNQNTVKGHVTLTLEDEKGNEVASTGIDAANISINKQTRFIFGRDSGIANRNKTVTTEDASYKLNKLNIKKGKLYTFVLKCEDIDAPDGFELVVTPHEAHNGPDATFDVEIDGKTVPGIRANTSIVYLLYSPKTMILLAMIVLLALAFVLFPFEKLDEKYPDKHISDILNALVFVGAPFAAYFITQKYMDAHLKGFLLQMFSLRGALNLLIIGTLWWLIYTISNRTKIASALTVLILSIFGIANYALLLFRETPLMATDFAQLGTALQVADSYRLTLSKPFLYAVFLTVLWLVVTFAPGGDKGLPLKKRVIPVAILVVWFAVFYYVFFGSTILKDNNVRISSFKPRDSYAENGCALSFALTAKNIVVQKPDGYDPAVVESLASQYPSDKAVKASKVSKKTPNVIVIMNESFSDLAVLGDIKTNEDWMPYYRSLKENTIKGWMDSSVFGGSTANSEFECLTGFSIKYMPYQSVPYRSVIKNPVPSLAYYMKSLGYGGITAFHPGMYNSYNRNNVYPLLGFDKHLSIDDVKDPHYIRAFLSDENDYNIIEQEYEAFRKENKDTPFFMFNVTIQNHGGFLLTTGEVDAGIKVEDPDVPEETVAQFVNLMKYSDEALKGLIDYYSKVDEETIIVLFGDHQPSLEDTFYPTMAARYDGYTPLGWSDLKHHVPFMMWANFDIEEREDAYLSANYISADLKQLLGLPLTGFDKYLLDLQKQLPIITAIDYQDTAGRIYETDEESEHTKKLNEYGIVQYNGLMDHGKRVEKFFKLAE